MRRFTWLGIMLVLPAVGLILAAPGCGKKEEKPADMTGTTPPPDMTGDTGTKTAPKGKKVAVAAGDGVIKGKVTFAGDPPSDEVLKAIKEAKDKCVAPDEFKKFNVDQRYLVSKDKGIANVLVVLKVGKDQYFEVADADKKRTDPVVIDQPYCAFTPHVSVLYPSYFDGKSQVKTGQKLLVKNSASFPHNTKIVTPGDTFNPTIAPGKSEEFDLKPARDKYDISCSIHAWMNAFVWAFDHPYAAVTDDNGNFEIKNVPTGVEVSVVAWHEVPGWFYSGEFGKKMTFKKGENKIDDIVVPAK